MNTFENEWEKMLNGEVYNAVHPEFFRRLKTIRSKLWRFNNLDPDDIHALEMSASTRHAILSIRTNGTPVPNGPNL